MTDYKNLKLIASSSPHIRSNEDTRSIMLDVIIALLPALAWSVYCFGWKALLLTAAELVRIVVGLLFHANLLQIHMRSFFCFLLRHAAHLHRCQHQVLQHSHMREKIEALEYHADFLTDFVDISLAVQRNTVDNDTAAGRLL